MRATADGFRDIWLIAIFVEANSQRFTPSVDGAGLSMAEKTQRLLTAQPKLN
jgi:hypothetical protein